MKEIYLIRHGQTEWNKLDLAQGQEADIPLNADGKKEAKKTGLYLKNFRLLDKQFDCIYSSPMKRASETAEIIKSAIGFDKDIIYDDDLKERKQGLLSGLSKKDSLHLEYSKLKKQLTPIDPIEKSKEFDNITITLNNKLNIGMETNQELEKRVSSAIEKIVESPHNKIIIVSHWGTLMSIISELFGIMRPPYGNFTKGANCWISYMTYDNGDWRLVTFPNTEHLGV